MSQILASLSGKTQQEFNLLVSKLEEISGFHSEDVNHLALATQTLRTKIKELGLDPDDTTGEELYHALLARYQRDAQSVDRAVGLSDKSGYDERVKKAIALARHSFNPDAAWTLRGSEAKRLIKRNVPKKLMKVLHYRSVDSMLKHEDVAVIFIGADLVESQSWHKKFQSHLAKLNTSSYELRPARAIALPSVLAEHCDSEPVLINGLSAAVAINPNLPGDTPALSLSLFILDGFAALSENHQSHKLHDAHPALVWWRDTEHLLFFNDGQPVSLNFKDVAKNHLLANNFESRTLERGQKAFWAGLMERYRQYVDDLPQMAAQVDQDVARTFNPVKDLVPEIVEV